MNTRQRFTRIGERFLPAELGLIEQVTATESPSGSQLPAMCAYHMETGGKRLRALLPLLVAEDLGEDPALLVPFGAACEMLHNATLVHDDLQDGDRTRRGRPTVWAAFGVPQAINLGDAMFYYALLLLQRLALPAERREALARRLLRETLQVIDGQEREFALKALPAPTLADYFRMVEGKTSGLFSLPVAGAAEALAAPDPVVEGLAQAARHLGVLFQIQDDVLDLYGDKGRAERGSDIGEGKRSALVVHALERLPARAPRLLAILDAPREQTGPAEVAEAMAILEEADALGFALAEIRRRQALSLSAPALRDRPALLGLLEGVGALMVEPISGLLSEAAR